MDVVFAAVAGAVAGLGARAVLAILRAPAPLPRGVPEAVVAVAWALVAWLDLPVWWAPVPAALAWLAVVLTATDVRRRLLPNAVTLPAYPVLATLLAVACLGGPGPALAWRALAGAVLLLAAHAVVRIASPHRLGGGDVKLAGLVGAVLGAVSWTAVLAGPALAAVVTLALAAVGRSRAGVPHGPGLLIAALVVALFPAAFAVAAPPGAGPAGMGPA